VGTTVPAINVAAARQAALFSSFFVKLNSVEIELI